MKSVNANKELCVLLCSSGPFEDTSTSATWPLHVLTSVEPTLRPRLAIFHPLQFIADHYNGHAPLWTWVILPCHLMIDHWWPFRMWIPFVFYIIGTQGHLVLSYLYPKRPEIRWRNNNVIITNFGILEIVITKTEGLAFMSLTLRFNFCWYCI